MNRYLRADYNAPLLVKIGQVEGEIWVATEEAKKSILRMLNFVFNQSFVTSSST